MPPPPNIAPLCPACHGVTLRFCDGLCPSCRRARKAGLERKPGKPCSVRCDCGRPAVAALVVQIGREGEQSVVLMPVCRRCLAIERGEE